MMLLEESYKNAVAKGGKDALNGTIWMNEEKQIPIKKVRCITSVKIH